MKTIKLFLASSSELADDRKEFELFINRKNKEWVGRGDFLELVVWEDFLDVMSRTRLQDEYNQAIRECALFVMLFFTKVGQFTEEEFDTAFGQFQATRRPFILTYFKDAPVNTGVVDEDDLMSLLTFKKKLRALGHYLTPYKNVEGLQLHFGRQLDKLAASGFIEFKPEETVMTEKTIHDSAIAQGQGAQAAAPGSVLVGRDNQGNINLGTQIHVKGAYVGGSVSTGGGDFVGRDKITYGLAAADLDVLFAPLLAAVVAQAPVEKREAASQQVLELRQEAAKGGQAEDRRMARIVDGLADLVPGAVATLVGAFASPILGGLAGPATQYVLDKLQGK